MVFRVNPSASQENLSSSYPSIREIRQNIDVVLLVVSPNKGIEVVHDMGVLGVKYLWIQPGASSSRKKMTMLE